MSDIHQEWRELREKNGDFINHLDGEMAKLKQHKQMQDLVDAGAFAMQFIAQPPFNCCQDDHDILKALNKAQADRIKQLEDEILAYKEQKQIDLAVKKDLDEKLDKATADYRALWVENKDLKSQLAGEKEGRKGQLLDATRHYAALENEKDRLTKTIRDLEECNKTLRERLANTNASLKRSIQENSKLQSEAAHLDNIRKCQAKAIERLQAIVDTPNGSCSAYTQQGMQSKIAKQAAEISRLTGDNVRLKNEIETLKTKLNEQTEANARLSGAYDNIYNNNKFLQRALETSAEDAKANFDRGKIKGMEEIWDELKDCYDGRPTGENEKIFGYYTVGEILMNLSPTWFINRAEEYHEQKEKEEACDIKIGDEVEIFDTFCPDDKPHSDFGIVTAVDEDHKCFVAVGPKFEGCFDMTDIDAGNARKTGKHYDSIPIDYFM